MLKAIIFDFNGIILNDEPVHFRAMREAVADIGIRLSEEDYWARYLPLDDERCLAAICRDNGVTLAPDQMTATLVRKVTGYRAFMRDQYPIFPGAVSLIQAAASAYPLAIASGARKDEVESTLDATDLRKYFTVVIAAEDFTLGKPHPESFLLALERLNQRLNGGSSAIMPRECVVIEDSVGGVQGALAAGMRCVAVTNSYPRERLTAASASSVVGSLEHVTLASLQSLCEENP
jgi:HAD superfamily hydrolase (TIGR01509 family)